ncbi:hypothetical protein BV898_02192 [Hypsibius exemplaris]|uniref:Uncharacterized protein n=1 Tax=Hypsibius exemplaris TaxID=2072580 RepID=A0A1W0X955_HYPEX|nr:hypothetical protein BV898_02192 [Hypsibius exemplaris]
MSDACGIDEIDVEFVGKFNFNFHLLCDTPTRVKMNAASKSVRLLLKTSPLTVTQKKAVSSRWGHVIPLPPRVRIQFAEKLLLGGFMCCGLVSIPVWVMYNLEYYKSGGVKKPDPRKETILELVERNEIAEGRK